MLKKLQSSIVSNLMQRNFKNDDELYLYLMSIAANVFAIVAHIYLLILFITFKEPLFTGVSLFSAIYYSFMFIFLYKRKYVTIGLMLSIEVTLYATFFGMMLGMESHVIAYFMLVIVMQVMVPYGTVRMRAWVIVFSIFCATACVVFQIISDPPFTLSHSHNNIFLFSNIYIMIFGVILELYVGNLAKIIIKSINDRKLEELSSQAYTDPLTGLYNRWYASKYFQSDLLKAETACIAMLDIDDFKNVNDTYGHPFGDEILKGLSNFLNQNLRKTDVVFRWGGEEFLIILTNVDRDAAYEVLDKLREKLSKTCLSHQQKDLYITITIGLCTIDFDNINESIEICDKNLYQGKNKGKNVVVG